MARQAKVEAAIRALMATSRGVSAGHKSSRVAPALEQYIQASQGLPSAGKKADSIPPLLEVFQKEVDKERLYHLLPSAGKKQDVLPVRTEAYLQASQNLPSAGVKPDVLPARTEAYLQASQNLPSAGSKPELAPPQDSTLNDPVMQTHAKALSETAQARGSQIYFAYNALNGGEIAPEMLARVDQNRYKTGCERLLNMVPMPQGGITKRPGFEPVGQAGSLGPYRLIPFVFSANESRVLEVYADTDNSIARVRVWFPTDKTFFDTALHNNAGWAYRGYELRTLSFAQSADVIYIAHPNHKPGKISRYADSDWRFEEINWLPAIDAPTGVAVEAMGNVENARMYEKQWYHYVVTSIDNDTGEESLASEVGDVYTHPVSDIWYNHISWNAVANAKEYRIYKKDNGVFGYIGTAENGETIYDDYNYTADTEDTPPRVENPFEGDGNYPSIVFLHQQRTGWASSNSHPLTIWLSQSGNYESMAASIPPEDDDCIEVTLAATQANRILWCQSDRDGLAVGTEGGEWLLTATDGAALTPSDLSFQPQTFHGSEQHIPVLRAGSHLIYVQRGGRVVQEFGYSFTSDRYESNDLSILARHMLRLHKIVAWAWQEEPYSIVWCVLDDGSMAGITYMKEHDVIGWHRHRTDGFVKDVVSIPGEDGNTQVWFVVQRNGAQYIERLRPFFQGGDPSGNWHFDGHQYKEFEARCIPCLPEANIQNGSTFLHVRKINAVKARVIFSMPFEARVGESDPLPVPIRGAEYTNGHADWAVPLASGWRENDRLELIFDGYTPVTVLGLTATVEVSDMAGGQE